jgi:hypothetical protein
MSVSINEKSLDLPTYNVNSISFNTISVNIKENTIYLNCNIITKDIIGVRVAPIYIYPDEFDNMVDIPKLNNIVEGLYGLTSSTTAPPVSKFRYIPQAPITS